MGIYIKGLDMPKEGECDIIAIHGNGEVCRWFAERNNEPIAEAEELGRILSEESEEDKRFMEVIRGLELIEVTNIAKDGGRA